MKRAARCRSIEFLLQLRIPNDLRRRCHLVQQLAEATERVALLERELRLLRDLGDEPRDLLHHVAAPRAPP